MGFLDTFKRVFTRAPKADTSSGLAQRFTPYGTTPPRGARESLHGYGTIPWLRGVSHRISGDIASQSWKLTAPPAKKGGERVEVTKHPFLELLANPCPKLMGSDVLHLTQSWLDLAGDGFWILERNAQGVPVQAWPAPPHWCMATPTAALPWFRFSHGTFQGMVPQADVVWWKEPNPEEPYGRGTGTALALADEIDTDEYAAKRTKAFFFNGGTPEIIVTAEGMSPEQAKAAKEMWEGEHRGFWNAFKSMWTGSKISVQRLDTSFKEMDLVALRQFERDTIIQVFGVAPEVLGILVNSNRATIDSAYYHYAKMVLLPRLKRLRAVFKELLQQFPGSELLQFDFDNPVPEDKAFALEVTKAHPSAFTANEVRRIAGVAPRPDGDELMVQAAPAFGAIGAGTDPEWVKSLPPRRVRNAADDAKRIEAVLEQLRADRLTSEVTPLWQDELEQWGKDTLAALNVSTDLLNPLIAPHVEQVATERIGGLVNSTTRDTLRAELSEGVQAGESAEDLSLRVESVFDAADEARADNIARTEVVGASNWATTEAYRQSGVVEAREWVATPDGRTRDTHMALDGQQRGLDENFEADGASAPYPGAFGDPAQDCNCRCTTTAVITDPADGEGDKAARSTTREQRVESWKRYDARLAPWEARAAAAIRRGFAAQRADMLVAVKALAPKGTP